MIELQARLDQALARIAELESELAARPKKRATRKVAGDVSAQCQYCADAKTDKITFLGLPMCRDWKPCASRIRRNTNKGADTIAYAYDRRYKVRKEAGRWVARFEGAVIVITDDQSESRELAHMHWADQAMQQVAA